VATGTETPVEPKKPDSLVADSKMIEGQWSTTRRFSGDSGVAHGLSLLELLIALAVVSIVLSIAVPSFNHMLARNRLAVVANELQLALTTARQMAIARNVPVTFCAGSPDTGCNGLWSDGQWVVFIDRDRDSQIDEDADVVRLVMQLPPSSTISLSANGALRSAVIFRPIGAAETPSGAFAAGRVRVCVEKSIRGNATDLVLIGSGRAVPEQHDFDGECPPAGS
jgi:type IV fimbrial biogenesis protein FimT